MVPGPQGPGDEVAGRPVLVVGTGSFGLLRARSFARRGHAVAFVSRDLARARAATAAVSGPVERAVARLEDGLAWAHAVFVATPPACHSDAVLAAARAGKSVLVEKPLEATLARARALASDLGASARLVTVAENYRFLPLLAVVAAARPRIGEIERVELLLHRTRPARGWRIERALSGGGVLADMGVHYVSLLRLWLGELAVDRAVLRARVPGTEVDGAFFVEGRGARGAWSIDMSWLAWRRRSLARIVGTRGTLRFRIGKRLVLRTTRLGLPVGGALVPAADSMGQEALTADWLAAVGRGEPGAVTLEEGLRDLAVVDAAYSLSSARDASWREC